MSPSKRRTKKKIQGDKTSIKCLQIEWK